MAWSNNEILKLKNLSLTNKTYQEIGNILNKTEGSVQQKMRRLGIKKNKEIFVIEYKCKNCYKKFMGNKNQNRKFCNKSCSVSYNNKKRELDEKTKFKISKSLKKEKIINKCLNCGKEIKTLKSKNKIYCNKTCSSLHKWKSEEYREKMKIVSKKRFSDINERKRMRDIGRMGGFGTKGYTNCGNYYESLLEKKCFEFLEKNKIKFNPHKPILNTSKVSDIYIDSENLWIELDGIDREYRKKWLGENYNRWIEKLNIYKNNDLNFVVFKNFEDFKEYIHNMLS